MALAEIMRIDWLVLACLLVGAARGAYLGAVRESLSVAVIAAALLIVRVSADPIRGALEGVVRLDGRGPEMLIIASGILLATMLFLFVLGRVLQSGGSLGSPAPIGRALGGVIGLAEGAVVALIVVIVNVNVMGSEDPSVRGSLSLEAARRAHAIIESRVGELPSWFSPSSRGIRRSGRSS